MKAVGQPIRKKDAMALVTGKPVFMDDLAPKDCLIVKVLRSPHANAIVKSVKTDVAKRVPGIEDVYTWEDVPQDRFTTAGQTYPELSPYDRLILDRHVRYVGDPVAIVAGENEACVDKALKMLKVEYEVLPAVLDFHMAKDSVQKRLNGEARDGLSFTEFTYQLLQGYDFLHLYETKNCKLQLGGSDQWGNITTGAELIRRTNGGEVFALTCPLITKADGGKFGKTESGNIWLDSRYTSPYKFYQFWLNVTDADAARYIKIFTSLPQEEIEALIAEQEAAPHLRPLQKRLAKEVTIMVHSEEDYNAAVEASNILFGNATSEALKKLDEATLLDVFNGVPQFEVSRDEIAGGVKLIDLCVEKANVFPSKGEMRKLIQSGGVSLNKEKVSDVDMTVDCSNLLDEKYLLIQRGKKNYYLIIAK